MARSYLNKSIKDGSIVIVVLLLSFYLTTVATDINKLTKFIEFAVILMLILSVLSAFGIRKFLR